MANLNQIQKEVSETLSILKSMQIDIKTILEKLGPQNPNQEGLESVAAKIINDISEKIDRCECTEKLEKLLSSERSEPKESLKIEGPKPKMQYSYPNFMVGNEGMGSSVDPNAIRFPLDFDK